MAEDNVFNSSHDSGDTHHASIDIESIKQKLAQISNPSLGPTSCIFRVPNRIREANPNAYTPDTVSIGPYHRGKDNVHAMEKQKLQYVKALLDRTEGRSSLKDYVDAVTKLEVEARACYSEPIKLSNKQFIEMMLIDGLFLIELFSGKDPSLVANNDPIFYYKIIRDLVLVENQIPITVLQKLFDLSVDPSGGYSLVAMATPFFDPLMPRDAVCNTSTSTHKHLLDLLYPYSIDRPSSVPEKMLSLPCVVDLQRSGVKFKKTSGSFKNMKFEKGVFEIPQIWIDDHTDTFLRNLIAYEQFSFQGTPYITSFAIVMDNLINTGKDVAYLRGCGIIISQLGDDYKVATLFNKLSTGISSVGFCYPKLCKDVNKYYTDPCNNWKATFKRNYCSSPWSCIGVFAATLGLILAAWGVVISTMSFFGLSFLNLGYRSSI